MQSCTSRSKGRSFYLTKSSTAKQQQKNITNNKSFIKGTHYVLIVGVENLNVHDDAKVVGVSNVHDDAKLSLTYFARLLSVVACCSCHS